MVSRQRIILNHQLYNALVSLIIKNHVSSELFSGVFGSENVGLPSTMTAFN